MRLLVLIGAVVIMGCSGQTQPSLATAPNKAAEIDDDVRVALVAVDRQWSGNFMRVVIDVSTTNPERHFQFDSWSSGSEMLPPARDDLGNSYPAVPGDRAKNIDGMVAASGAKFGSGGVTSDTIRYDVLYYHIPAPSAKKIFIELPARNVGGKGQLQFTTNPPKPLD